MADVMQTTTSPVPVIGVAVVDRRDELKRVSIVAS